MPHFSAAFYWPYYCSHFQDHWLTTFQDFLSTKWVKFFSARKSPLAECLSSQPVRWIWVEILWCGYNTPFLLYQLSDTCAFRLLKNARACQKQPWMKQALSTLVPQPPKTIKYMETRSPNKARGSVAHFPSDGPSMVSGHQDNSKLSQVEASMSVNGNESSLGPNWIMDVKLGKVCPATCCRWPWDTQDKGECWLWILNGSPCAAQMFEKKSKGKRWN